MDGPSFEFEWASDLFALWCPIDSGSDFYPRELRNRRRFYFTRFRLGIVGDARTGKSTFVRRHLTGEFEQGYEPTRDLRFENLDFHTNYGNIHFCCKDFNRPIWQRQGRSQFIDCAIIMFDVTDRRTYENVPTWHEDLRRNRRQIPIVLCGNKVDMENRQVTTAELVTFRREMNLQYYEISVRSNYNIEKPFLYLARKLVGDQNLHFVEPPALAPPVVQIDLFQRLLQIDLPLQQLHEQELAAAAAQPLPDDDDEFLG